MARNLRDRSGHFDPGWPAANNNERHGGSTRRRIGNFFGIFESHQNSAPNLYGIKNPKWVTEIQVIDGDFRGFWQQRGWTNEGIIKTMSRIDVPANGSTVAGGYQRIGGLAFAGSRGIQEVQIRCGGGSWKNAILEEPLSPYTLTRWWAEWDGPVTGTLEVRARDGEGNWQATMETPLFPSGVQGPTRIVLS